MKKKNPEVKLSLKKKTITSLSPRTQESIAGGLTQYTTCCGSLPQDKKYTACYTLASCPNEKYVC